MEGDGQLKDFSHRSNVSLVRLLGGASLEGMISEVKREFILCNILISI